MVIFKCGHHQYIFMKYRPCILFTALAVVSFCITMIMYYGAISYPDFSSVFIVIALATQMPVIFIVVAYVYGIDGIVSGEYREV